MIDFSAPADAVAPQLLGCFFSNLGVTVRITEVEAYLGAEDEASHTYRGKTPRNAAMFGPPGHMYIYISYGIHTAANIVCAPEGVGHGCLLRAGEVVAGEKIARTRRGSTDFHNLARGPGNFGSALGLDLAHNGQPITGPAIMLRARDDEPEWVCGPRIGISKNVDAPLRFWIPHDRSVSGRRGYPRT